MFETFRAKLSWGRSALLVVVLFGAAPASATHENDHRYVVEGVVRDDAGAPIPNAKVQVTGLGGRPLGEGFTDGSGRYRIVLHMHGQDRGTKFWVSADGKSRAGTVEFDPADRWSERGQRIDLPAQPSG